MKHMRWFGPVGFAVRPEWAPRQGSYDWNHVHVVCVGPLVLAWSTETHDPWPRLGRKPRPHV